jgi:flagellar hook assembly protein FlgD
LEVQVQVFTVSGKLVKTINKIVQTSGTLARNISWNGLDDFGNKIGKGVYIYKLKVKSTTSSLVSEKYEKLVILQ